MLNAKSVLSFVLVFVVLSAYVSAQDIVVTKTAPSQIKLGNTLTATITVANNMNQQTTVTAREGIGDAKAISPQLVTQPTLPGNMIAAIPPYFRWSLTIDANSQKTISYTIQPNKAGYYLFSPTLVTTADGRIFYSNALSTSVGCNSNGVCEPQLGEDYTNCPQDCPPPVEHSMNTGSSFNYLLVVGIAVAAIALVLVLMKRKPIDKGEQKMKLELKPEDLKEKAKQRKK